MEEISEKLLEIAACLEKSTENNAKLFEKLPNYNSIDGKIIGTGRSDYTQGSTEYNLTENEKPFVLIDIPGIEGNESQFEETIKDSVNKAHLVVYVNGSNKKTEPKTVEKIKKYLRNDTDVYSVCNVHCLPKKNRDVELDGTYEEELQKVYKSDKESLLPQTENALKSVLGDNFKNGFCINGLLSFCSYAYNSEENSTTIIPDTDDKSLRKIQSNFIKEFDGDFSRMKEMSEIKNLLDVINDHSKNFDSFIIESNKKKLLARINSSVEIIDSAKTDSKKRVEGFCHSYESMITNVKSAADDFKNEVSNLVQDSVEPVINDELNKFYEIIENNEGKLKDEEYKSFFDSRQNKIKSAIEKNFNSIYKESLENYQSKLEEAKKRFEFDLNQNVKNASAKVSKIDNISFKELEDAVSYTLKAFGKDALTTASLAASFAGVGGLIGTGIPGLGNVVGAILGAVLGAILGVAKSVFSFFQSKETRIANARKKAKEIFTKVSDGIISDISENVSIEQLCASVNENSENVANYCEQEIAKLKRIDETIGNLLKEISNKKSTLEALGYGKI